MPQAIKTVWSRGGVWGFYQGLVPWGWIEASTKGSVLLFATSELEYRFRAIGLTPAGAGILGGMGGGIAVCLFIASKYTTRPRYSLLTSKPTRQWVSVRL